MNKGPTPLKNYQNFEKSTNFGEVNKGLFPPKNYQNSEKSTNILDFTVKNTVKNKVYRYEFMS